MAVSSTYVHPVAFSSVLFCLPLYYLALSIWLDAAFVPEAFFGPISRFVQFAHENYSHYALIGLAVIGLVHVVECMVALHRCRKLGICGAATVAWLLQTLVFGIGSLKFLLWPVDDSSDKRE